MYTILFNFVTFNSHMKWGREKKLFILYSFKKKKEPIRIVRCGVRTHALSREPELKSGALDRSANLTC